MAVGLGGEQLWLSPTVANNVNPFDDQSGQGNNGTAQGGLSTVADTSNGGSFAYDFDGTNDYISNSSLDLRNLPAMSWSAWVKDDKTSGLSSFFSHGLNGQYSNDTYFFQSAGNNRFQVNQSGDGSGSATSPTSSTWNHLAVVFDGSGAANSNRLRYFANGVEVALSYDYTVPATTGNPSSSSTRIGDYVSAPGSNLFVGRQDDIRAYNRVLTQSEITHLATSRGVLGPPGGATHYNPFKSHAFINDFQQRLR